MASCPGDVLLARQYERWEAVATQIQDAGKPAVLRKLAELRMPDAARRPDDDGKAARQKAINCLHSEEKRSPPPHGSMQPIPTVSQGAHLVASPEKPGARFIRCRRRAVAMA